jgi:hypothetical protein
MSHDEHERRLVAQLGESLTHQRYNPVVVHNYCRNANNFLSYLGQRKITLEEATPTTVSTYLRFESRQFLKRHGHSPAPQWESIPRAGVHGLLRFALKYWPPRASDIRHARTSLSRSLQRVPDVAAGGARASSRVD